MWASTPTEFYVSRVVLHKEAESSEKPLFKEPLLCFSNTLHLHRTLLRIVRGSFRSRVSPNSRQIAGRIDVAKCVVG